MITDVILFWNKKAVEIFNLHTSPPHDARRFAVIHIAFHNVLNSINEKYKRYAYTQPVVNNASVEVALITAAKEVLIWAVKDFRKFVVALPADVPSPLKTKFSDDIAKSHITNIIDLYEGQMALLKPLDQHKVDAVNLGLAVVTAITTLRDADSSIPIQMTSPLNDGTDQYKFRGNYYNTFPPPTEKLIVYYQDVIPFVVDNNSMYHQTFTPSSNSEIADVENRGSKTNVEDVQKLPIQTRHRVDYWSDIRQHVLWNNFTLKLIETNNLTDAWKIARLLALIHTAMADGTIAMFRVLYEHYHWRPSTAINDQRGVSPLAINDVSCWIPYKPVPRVPEFPSVFGIFSGVVGVILNDNFNNSVVNLDHVSLIDNSTHVQIVYNSIDDAVMDNANTKVNCGWNFQSTIDTSLSQGKKIGVFVNSNAFTAITPPSPPSNKPNPDLKRYPKWRLILDKSFGYLKAMFKKLFPFLV